MSISTFDNTKPATSTPEASAEIRNNFGALQSALGGVNLVADPIFEIWAGGDAVAPTHYTYTSGTGGSIARAGTSLGDTGVDGSTNGWSGGGVGPVGSNWGAYCPKLVYGSASQTLRQQILGATGVKSFVGLPFAIGCWVKTSTASAGRIDLYDGISHNYSSYHNGDNTWHWITAYMASGISSTATGLWAYMNNDAGTVYFSGLTVLFGSTVPQWFIMPPIGYGWISPGTFQGAVSVQNQVNGYRVELGAPAIVRAARARIGTAPTTQAVIWRPQKSGNSIYATQPQIAAAASDGTAGQPDGTYANRCFTIGDYLSFDVTQVGSGTTGSDLTMNLLLAQYQRPTLPYLSLTEMLG